MKSYLLHKAGKRCGIVFLKFYHSCRNVLFVIFCILLSYLGGEANRRPANTVASTYSELST